MKGVSKKEVKRKGESRGWREHEEATHLPDGRLPCIRVIRLWSLFFES